jgi:hypothetical protein
MGLASHANVYNTCLRILRSRGFALEVSGEPRPDGAYPTDCHWIARKDGFYFCADNPIELLGLVAISDHVRPEEDRPYWWAVHGPDIESELMEAAFPDEPPAAESGAIPVAPAPPIVSEASGEPNAQGAGGKTVAHGQSRERPSQYDGTQFVIFVDLPPRAWTTAGLYEYVYGVRLSDGAKPWPYFRDAQTKQWWALTTPDKFPVDALAWMIDLDQLGYKPLGEAQAYLEAVLPELETRAARFGGAAEAEGTVPEALAKMGRVREVLRIRDYQVTVVVGAPEGEGYGIAEWWRALEGAGLEYGDGNLFWLYNASFTEDGSEPYELFCAEPYSRPGYFHPHDRGGKVRFPDVALHFRARDVADPVALLRRMAQVAEQAAASLGAVLLTDGGQPFELAAVESRLQKAMEELRALQDTVRPPR